MNKDKMAPIPPSDSQPYVEQKTVDFWSEVHRRLERALAAAEHGVAKTCEEKKEVLKARAKELAREPENEKAAGDCLEVLEFLLACETYAIESMYVREVFSLKELTPLPCTPSFVLGIINVRGQILSVIDIKNFFSLPERGLSSLNKIIILHNDDMEFGILADAVNGTRTIPLESIQPSLPTLTGIRAEYLKGIASERLVVLDAAKILSDKKIIVHEEVEV